jgi:hypothetical protein
MQQQQIVGLVLLAVAVVDTAVGHLVIAPRVADEQKRNILRVAFSISGVGIAGLALAVYQGIVSFD